MFKVLAISLAISIVSTGVLHAQVAQRFDVLIDEILSDPTPPVSLPNAEFVELKNTSGKNMNLQGWRLSSNTSRSGAFPSYVLPADSFLVLSSTSSAVHYAKYGRTLGIISFPSLGNAGTTLTLTSKEGFTIHSVSYTDNWLQNDLKKNGGWSLEMIDTKNPCAGHTNWKASVDARGGTPASINSVDAVNPDNQPPALLRAIAIDSITVELSFSEPLDSMRASFISNYTISDGINMPVNVSVIPPSFGTVRLTLSSPITRNKIYTITTNNVSDCTGNVIQAMKTARLALPTDADGFDVVINEILFDPKHGSTDYVELYNRSNSVFNLKNLYLANRSWATNLLGKPSRLTTDNMLFFPGEFIVLSESAAMVMNNYIAKNPDHFLDIMMPSFPNDKGVTVLLNAQGDVVDELGYDSKWHFALIDNPKGVALERIDYNKPTKDKDNWTSASSTSGFGTPTYQNSQFRMDVAVQGNVTITPKVLSPDNDGIDDFTNIKVVMTEPGFVANITIFDVAGRPVRYVAKNATLSSVSSFRWDGLNDKMQKLPVGIYIVFSEVFNLQGKKRSFKNTLVVASRN